jgi:PAS domain S-box-containing protein
MKHPRIPGMVTIFIIIIAMIPMLIHSQTYLSRGYTVNDGLLSPTVNDITQDKTGRMWFATPIGVTCYDGTTWKNYSASDGLPLQIYTKVHADTRGNIWAFTMYLQDGIYFFDREHQSWNHLEKPPGTGDEKITITSIAVMEYPESRQDLYIGIGTKEQGFYIYTRENWIHAGKKEQGASVLKVDCHNHLFYVVAEGVAPPPYYYCRNTQMPEEKSWNENKVSRWSNTVSPETTQSRVFVINPDSPHEWEKKDFKTPTPDIYSVTFDKSNPSSKETANVPGQRIWLTGEKWVGYYFQDNFHLLYRGDFPGFHKNTHYKIPITLPDQFGGFWLGNDRVLLNIDKTGNIKLIGIPETLQAVGAHSLFYDRESNFWIGTYRGAVKITSFRFENYRRKDGLYDDEVSSISGFGSKNMIFGHNGGITFFIDNQFYPYEIPGSDRKNIAESRVIDLSRDREGNTWAAVGRMGIMKISPSRQIEWCPVIIPGNATRGGISFSSVLCDSRGNIWASGDQYIFQWKNHRFIPLDIDIIPNTYIRRLFESKDGGIYIAAASMGLLELKNNKIIKQFRCPDNESANSIYAVYLGKQGNILLGTKIGLFTLENDKIVKFQQNDFRVDRPIYFIVEDADGYLWFGLNNGVIKWDGFNRANGTRGEHVRHYTRADGLAGNEANRAASFVDQNGRLWIGTEGGVSCYYKERDRICEIPPLLELLYLKVSYPPRQYPLNRDHSFAYYYDDLAFYFKGISFIDENAVRYNFKLEGIDRQWITDYQAPDNQIRYLNIPPGKYRFHIQAINSLGTKSPILSSGLITIKKPFSQTWWFYFLLLVVPVILIFFIANFISKRRYAAHLEEQIRERTRQLEESEKEFRNIFNSAHDAIIIMEPYNEIVYNVNDRACEIYGFSRQEFIGMSLIAISRDVDRGKQKIKEIENLQKGDYLNFDTVQYREDGSEMFLEINASVINYRGKLAILSINRDITQRKRAELQIKESLREKEILLKEIHHRVKNNLQVISSLLDLQADALGDTHINKAIQDSKDRIHSMALIHENLYQFGDLARINGIEYIHNLVEYIFNVHGDLAEHIASRVQIEMPSLALDMDTAIPIGLILTELLSNALKHAFPTGKKGEIHVAVHTGIPGMLTLVVRDNGVGLPQDISVEKSQSLGLQLVQLLTQQVKGTIEIKTSKGTTVTITFPYHGHQ